MNYLLSLTQLKNNYYVMLANCEGLIVSRPKNGLLNYGLSEKGQQQVKVSAFKLINTFDRKIQIISSDFKRAEETANITHQSLKVTTAIKLDERLRERDFGDFELRSDTNYQITWNNDAKNSAHTINNVESANDVMTRVTKLILDLENEYSKSTLLLVAHGDTLQILQTAFQKKSASKQRELAHLENAEIQELHLKIID